jgi:hypothetical protein
LAPGANPTIASLYNASAVKKPQLHKYPSALKIFSSNLKKPALTYSNAGGSFANSKVVGLAPTIVSQIYSAKMTQRVFRIKLLFSTFKKVGV